MANADKLNKETQLPKAAQDFQKTLSSQRTRFRRSFNQNGGEGRGASLPPYKYIKNNLQTEQFSQSTYRTLAEDLKYLKGQERSHRTGQEKRGKKEEVRQNLCPWEGTEKAEMSLLPRKPLHWQGDQSGQKRGFRGSEESAVIGLWQAEQSVGSWSCHCPWRPSLRHTFAGVSRGWNWGFTGQTGGEDWGWWHRDSLKELKRGTATARSVHGRSPGPPKKQSTIVL